MIMAIVRRSSISSSTKKFICKTLESFKSFLFSMRYQKLPKKPSCKPFSSCIDSGSQADYRDVLDKVYDELIKRHDENSHQKSTEPKKKIRKKSDESNKNIKLSIPSSSSSSTRGEKGMTKSERRSLEKNELCCEDEGVKGCCRSKDFLVAKKLKELRKLEMSNVDHILDIEEVLHYYSRLTCPAYLGVIDKFFMEIYSEFLGEVRRN